MRKFMILCAVCMMLVTVSEAKAWGFRARTRTTSVSVSRFTGSPSEVALQKATIMANRHLHGHIGGGFGGGHAEGTGFSIKSATVALNNCCFTGQRQCIGLAVVRGLDGWYAVKIFR